jgi:hypothetical protein
MVFYELKFVIPNDEIQNKFEQIPGESKYEDRNS